MTGQLQISTGPFTLPESLITERVGVVGSSGYGKTHLLTVIAEELLDKSLPVVIIDPEGVFGGLRSSFDGKKPGYKIAVLGGHEGDIGLEPTAGRAIADVVVATRQSMVLDLSSFEEEDDETTFVADFCQRIYATNPRLPLEVIIDEIDKFAPESPTSKGQVVSTRAVKNLVQRGRNRALGSTIASQRPAVIKKDILYQVRCLFAFNLGGPLDQDAIAKWMLRTSGLPKSDRDEFMESLPKLQRGAAWCWSPAWLDTFTKIHVRERRTFDSSKTPEIADLTRQRTKQHVDLTELQRLMAATIESSNDEDPERLRARIRQLEAELTRKNAAGTPIEVPVVTEKELALLEECVRQADKDVRTALAMGEKLEAMVQSLDEVSQRIQAARSGTATKVSRARPVAAAASRPNHRKKPELVTSPAGPAMTPRIPIPGSDRGSRQMGRCELALLTAIAQRHPSASTLAQISIMSNYSINSSSFKNSLTALRQAGYIVGDKKTPISITDEGRRAVPHVPPMPKGSQLLQQWKDRLGLCSKSLLTELASAYPNSLTKNALSEATGYTTTSSSFKNSLTELRKLELISGYDDLKASPNLFDTPKRRAAS